MVLLLWQERTERTDRTSETNASSAPVRISYRVSTVKERDRVDTMPANGSVNNA